MPFTVTMPKLSPTMDEGTIVKWTKKEGEFVEAGEVIIEVATDKATVEYEALDEGWLRQVLVKEGDIAAVNQPIAVFTAEQNEAVEDFKIEEAPVKEEAPVEEKAEIVAEVKQTVSVAQPQFVPEPPLEDYEFSMPRQSVSERLHASPLARRIAKEKGVDISTIKGSGPGDRVMSRDLDLGQPTASVAFGHREIPTEQPGSYSEEPLSPIRKIIAQRLQEAKSFIPHFYVTKTINAEPLVAFKDQLRELGIKVSINDCVIRACALALREHADVNSAFNSTTQSIAHFNTIDISVAVGAPTGLITPIIRHADFKNLGEISVEMRKLAGRAKEGKLEPQEYKGGSFTISNLGMFGVSNFQAIINPPQAAILAVSGILDVPVVKDGEVVPGKTMDICLSVDHRVVDGVGAAEFLQTVQKFLENPSGLAL